MKFLVQLNIKLISVTRDGVEVKVCAFEGLDLEAGESHTDERCYFNRCGENFELISGFPPQPGQTCKEEKKKEEAYPKPTFVTE